MAHSPEEPEKMLLLRTDDRNYSTVQCQLLLEFTGQLPDSLGIVLTCSIA